MPQGNSPTAESTDAIRMEPMGRYKQVQNGNVHPEGGVAGTESPAGPTKKSLYENNGVAACSQKRALFIASAVFAILFLVSIIIAYTGPQSECTCAGEKPPNYVDEDWNVTKVFVPRATNGQVFPWNNIRLPTFAKPSRYNITIHPNLTTLDVKGQVSIEFHVEKDTHFIVLHSKNLTITDKMIQDRKGHNLRITKLLEYPAAQQLYIEIKDKFRKRNNYTLNLRFTSKLGHEYEGFYISSYTNEDGDKRYLATTHFEPTYARAAFPCFDEPQFKAKFKISIFRDRFHIALFNMPVVTTEDVGFYMGTGLLRDDFQESVEMSTYLVAFVICDYKHLNKQTERGVSVSVYTPSPYISQASFALSTATHIMNFFEDFFMVPYPLPKQDLVVIPDFATGAMENWGLITYRETAILYDPLETSTAAHQWVAIVIAHELAHQWFGNLVTMKWWNDLWLNEGFASFLEYLGVDSLFPEWRMMEQFILDKTQPALALDALVSSHPISVSVYDPSEIEAIFDTISYSKGASILHMLGKFLQQETLQNGLNDYLNTYKYSNADTKELWNVFSRNTNQSLEVKTIMDTWTNQMGFPLITITREENEVYASQERFLLTTEGMNSSIRSSPKSKYDYKWYVPLTYITDNDTDTINYVWMNMTNVRFEIDPDVKWIKVNVNQSGFYRVMYDDNMWASIIDTLRSNHTIFNAADRASLIDDAFTLCRAGLLNASIPLEMSLYLIDERDYVPWATAIEHFESWSRRLSESLAYKLFLQYMRKLLEPITKFVGWNDDGTHLQRLMRTDILSTAVHCELNETVSKAKSSFMKWMKNNETIAPDLKEVVYAAGIKYGGLAEWQHCWNIYNTTKVPSEKKLLLKALGVASDPWLLQRYLLETLDRDMVKPQDVKIVLAVVAANPEGRLHAWRHLKAYWPTMQSLFGNATFMMGSLISAVTAHLSTPYDLYDVSTYFNGMHVGSASRALEQSLETIKLNINWVSQNEADIYTWLRRFLNK
ncbi:PREDICTED: endoplasmic reticulum aminopeptidase 1-like isoform X2 [Nicrophorus vespilloides]|uniref:Aminopeptidase n=1 Tax=Nicrophorus vespilloides TaxID=110193 RepID=A0ABM1MS24_NICVS|nr:PREDICTED: endoplasmic reticulum aminopeptidase 1-like isoform X2 [Nicrophorus vespilloides]